MSGHAAVLDTRATRIDLYRRALDIVVSAVLLVAALPFIVAIALGSAVLLGAWPFFVQCRVGRGGQTFRFLKIRTLRPDVPHYIDKHHLEADRIPSLCQAVRKHHLDELPQLVLVLTGKMSLVGPRPEMPHLHNRMAPAFADLRTSVRPGCTGIWQISDECVELIGDSPEYDRFYLAHRTLRLDLWILFRTALNMLGLGRSITLADVPGWTRASQADDVIVLADRHSEEATVSMTSAAAG